MHWQAHVTRHVTTLGMLTDPCLVTQFKDAPFALGFNIAELASQSVAAGI